MSKRFVYLGILLWATCGSASGMFGGALRFDRTVTELSFQTACYLARTGCAWSAVFCLAVSGFLFAMGCDEKWLYFVAIGLLAMITGFVGGYVVVDYNFNA